MKVAIVDCGTNTFNLLIAEKTDQGVETLFSNKLPVKLGAGGFENKEILPSRFVRGLDALLSHKTNIDNFQVEKVFAFATSAVREASNGREFIEVARKNIGIDIELIDGDREAELIYKGIKQTYEFTADPTLIMDIGGGSTEFIIANNTGILWKQSFLLGVSRLHDQLKPNDRMTHEDVHRLRNVLDKQLMPLKNMLKELPCQDLVGSSGSFDTLLDLFRKAAKDIDPAWRPGLLNEINISAFPAIHAYLMGSTYEERLKHPAIPAIRAEYMPLASYLIKFVLEHNKFRRLYHSAYALKEGALEECMNRY